MTDAAHRRWEEARKAEVKAFKPITRTYTISSCPECYGGLPQGNESAWAKGCNSCRLKTECGEATDRVMYASMTDKEFNDRAKHMIGIGSKEWWMKTFGNDKRLTIIYPTA